MGIETNINKNKWLPAIPPEDYTGTQAAWMVALQERGLWDGEGWHGDVMIRQTDWMEILEYCEEGYGPGFITYLDQVKPSKMKMVYNWLQKGAFILLLIGGPTLLMGSVIWLVYPRIAAISPGLIRQGYLAPTISWWDCILIMILVELAFSLGTIRDILKPDFEDDAPRSIYN